MKYLLIILLLSCKTAQVTTPQSLPAPRPVSNVVPINYYLKTIGKETGVVNYKIQQSTNNRNWTTVATLYAKYLPDSNSYIISLPVPQTDRWYRTVCYMQNGSYTSSTIFVKKK